MENLDLHYIEDDALKATVTKVFARLPEAVQGDLKLRIWEILANSIRDRALETMEQVGTTGHRDECFPARFEYRICLHRKIGSESARTFVVAHEFAHAYLCHPTYILWIHQVAPSQTSGDLMMKSVEEQANLQVCLWGFRDELIAFHQEYPNAPAPEFLTELTEGETREGQF